MIEMKRYNDIHDVFIQHGGIVKTSEILRQGFHNRYLVKLMEQGKVVRLKPGYYQWIEENDIEEAAIIAKLFPDAVVCLDSALYYHSYTDRTPVSWHLAVDKDSSKSRFNIKFPPIQPYFTEGKYLGIGIETVYIQGIEIKVSDRERTICDVLRYANKMDREIVNKAIQAYIKDPKQNITRLMEYAKKLRVLQKVKNWVGVWL